MAKVAQHYFSRENQYRVAGFTANKEFMARDTFCGLNVHPFEGLAATHPPSEYDLFIAIGPSKMNSVREEKLLQAKELGYRLASFISSNAVCESPVGENSFIADFAVVQPFVEMGSNNFVWEHALVANESVIGSHCYIAPRATLSSYSSLGDNCVLGTASVVKTRVSVAAYSLIGAACYVSRNTNAYSVYGTKQSALLGQLSMKVDLS